MDFPVTETFQEDKTGVVVHDLNGTVKVDSSFWTIEDDTLHITLQKREKGKTWQSPILVGQGQLEPYASDVEQKCLMLQRFQEEKQRHSRF